MRILPRSRSLVSLLAALSAASAQFCFGQGWEKILAAGKKEGKVAVIGPVGADRRDVLVEPFQKKYGITVEYFADRGSGIGPRLSAERGAGQYLWSAGFTGPPPGRCCSSPQGFWIRWSRRSFWQTSRTPSNGAAGLSNSSIRESVSW